MLRHDESPLWHLQKIAPTVREQELRNFLGGFNFPGDMVTSSIAPFSGGEKARLALALIVWQRPNLLLLDEPTNHLDLETREALTLALAQFEGTLVVVSHDRHLLRATTDQFIIVADGTLQPFDGDLDDYKDWLFQTKLGKRHRRAAGCRQGQQDGLPGAAPPRAPRRPSTRKEQKRLEAEERQRLAALKKPIENSIKRLEEQIAKRNAQKAEVDAQLGEPGIYDAANKDEAEDSCWPTRPSSPRTWRSWKRSGWSCRSSWKPLTAATGHVAASGCRAATAARPDLGAGPATCSLPRRSRTDISRSISTRISRRPPACPSPSR